jgi:Zn-dependent metalloprotease
MVFGDGDAEIFQDFTRSSDVIAHELTHGVTQNTANLPYHFQSGALNEHISDAFGSMVKQFINDETAETADWLIGAGIFHKAVGAKALRSMKAPGTAFKNTLIGSDRQPGHMDQYQDLPDTRRGDYGGVHINSGIPNKAFQLVCTGLGGYSWEVGGKIWYDSLLDPKLRTFAADDANLKKCFQFFAELTVAHAEKYSIDGKDVKQIVIDSWQQVGIVIGNVTGGGDGVELIKQGIDKL